ncbi:hypothetical protein KY363_04835 [Candidatus Woesearchaeota archaeon]|nr:hypothetical protein [Candidatus Woesearchaeota archaeon]
MAIENATSIILNDSVNQTAPVVFDGTKDYIFNVLYPRVHELVLAPFNNPDMVWTLAPLILALLLMQIYFGRNKDEALGWNTAFGNSIALLFISASLLRGVYLQSGGGDISDFLARASSFSDISILIITAVFLYGILLSTISFYHWIPESIAFFIMNGISINVTAYVAIVLVNSEVPLDKHTLLAGVVIFIVVWAIAMLIRLFIPASTLSRIHLLERRRYILEQKEKHFHHLSMKAKSDWRKNRMEARASHYQRSAAKVGADIQALKAHRLSSR